MLVTQLISVLELKHINFDICKFQPVTTLLWSFVISLIISENVYTGITL